MIALLATWFVTLSNQELDCRETKESQSLKEFIASMGMWRPDGNDNQQIWSVIKHFMNLTGTTMSQPRLGNIPKYIIQVPLLNLVQTQMPKQMLVLSLLFSSLEKEHLRTSFQNYQNANELCDSLMQFLGACDVLN